MQGEHFTGNPVKDLVEIVFECYRILSSILNNYNPTGDDFQDKCVVALSQLFVHWPLDKLAVVKAAMDNFVPEDTSHPPHLETSHEHARDTTESNIFAARVSIAQSMSKVISGIGFGTKHVDSPKSTRKSSTPKQQSSSRHRNKSGQKKDLEDTTAVGAAATRPSLAPLGTEATPSPTPEDIPPPAPEETPPPAPEEAPPLVQSPTAVASSSPASGKNLDDVQETSHSPVAEGHASGGVGGVRGGGGGGGGSQMLSTKNQEYFRKMREVAWTALI